MSVDMFLKIEGIDGESHDKNHAKEIEILSWSWGASQSGTASLGGGMGAGKVSMNDFHFTMYVNKSSPKLLLHCANGKHIPTASLTCRKAAGDAQLEYYKYKFTDLLVSSFQTGGSSGHSDLPVESISFNFSKIEVVYNEQGVKGTGQGDIMAGWDLKKNVAV